MEGRYSYSNILIVILVAMITPATPARCADVPELEKLKSSFEKRRETKLLPVGKLLLTDLQKLEKHFAKQGNIENASHVQTRHEELSKKLARNEAASGFPLHVKDLPGLSELEHKSILSIRKTYRDRVSKALLPVTKIYVTELGKIEKQLTKKADYKSAIRVKAERLKAARQLKLLTGSKSLPREAVEWGRSHYLLIDNQITWKFAKEECEKMGGHLVTISSKEENQFVRKLSQNKSIWLGATDEKQEGTWVWITGEPFLYTHWHRGSPDNNDGNQHYAHYWANGGWDDACVKTKLRFLCEWDLPDYY